MAGVCRLHMRAEMEGTPPKDPRMGPWGTVNLHGTPAALRCVKWALYFPEKSLVSTQKRPNDVCIVDGLDFCCGWAWLQPLAGAFRLGKRAQPRAQKGALFAKTAQKRAQKGPCLLKQPKKEPQKGPCLRGLWKSLTKKPKYIRQKAPKETYLAIHTYRFPCVD